MTVRQDVGIIQAMMATLMLDGVQPLVALNNVPKKFHASKKPNHLNHWYARIVGPARVSIVTLPIIN